MADPVPFVAFKTFTLAYPVVFKGQTYLEIPMRRPKIRDLRIVSGPSATLDPIGAQNKFLGALAELPEGVFEELDLEDAEQFTEYADSFLKVKTKLDDSSTPG
jgi:hypothetical protein